MNRRTLGTAALSAGVLIVGMTTFPAVADSAPPPGLHVSQVLTSQVVGPLQFTVSGSQVLVADSFLNLLTKVGAPAPIASYTDPGGDLAGVAYDRDQHSIAYATSNFDHSSTALHILRPGHAPVVADLSQFELTHNPDGAVKYGVTNPSQCVVDAFAALDAPASYTGDVDSHPYAIAALGQSSFAVADAGGNDVLKVDAAGNISVLAVLPALPVTITPAFAAASGLPACTLGLVYNFEAVPTDVARGPDGALFVSSLPGGPEGPEGGNPGSVYRLAKNGALSKVATGFHGATNLAIDSHGSIFVAEISSGTISKVVNGGPSVVLNLPGVVAVEFANGHLYASTAPAAAGGAGPGTVVKLSS